MSQLSVSSLTYIFFLVILLYMFQYPKFYYEAKIRIILTPNLFLLFLCIPVKRNLFLLSWYFWISIISHWAPLNTLLERLFHLLSTQKEAIYIENKSSFDTDTCSIFPFKLIEIFNWKDEFLILDSLCSPQKLN